MNDLMLKAPLVESVFPKIPNKLSVQTFFKHK